MNIENKRGRIMKTIKSKGAFVQYEDSSWGIDTRIKIDAEYKHFKKKGYPTLSSAKADYERAKEEFIQKNTKHHETMFYEQLTDEYLKMRKLTVAMGTAYMSWSVTNTYFAPYFKGKLIKDFITRESIKEWYYNIASNPKIGSNRKNTVIGAMRDYLKFAYMNEYIDPKIYQSCDVVLLKVKEQQNEKHERIAWNLDEMNKFFSVIPTNSSDYLMFRLFFTCAPRISEFLALMPRCYDSKKKRISIEQQVLYSYHQGKNQQLTNRLKTKDSYRTILLPNELAELLDNYIKDLSIKEDEYIFFGKDRHTAYAKTTFKRRLDKYCDLAGVRRINPHGARHTLAVLLSSVSRDHTDLVAAAKRLGHSPEVFMNTYANHKNEEKESELLGKVFEA